MGRITEMAKEKTSIPVQKDSGRGLPVTNTSTPKPPTKPPAQSNPSSVPKTKK